MRKRVFKWFGVFVLILLIGFMFLPKYFISEEDQKCIINYHCSNLDCSEINNSLNRNDLAFYEPMCISNKCECEWSGNLLQLE